MTEEKKQTEEERLKMKEDLYAKFDIIALAGRSFEKNKMKLLDLIISNLEESIKKSIAASDKLSNKILWLTFVGTVATIILTIFTIRTLL